MHSYMRQMSLSHQSHARVDEETQSFLQALFPQCAKTQSLIKTPLLSHQWLHGIKLDGYYFLVSSPHSHPHHHTHSLICFLAFCSWCMFFVRMLDEFL